MSLPRSAARPPARVAVSGSSTKSSSKVAEVPVTGVEKSNPWNSTVGSEDGAAPTPRVSYACRRSGSLRVSKASVARR